MNKLNGGYKMINLDETSNLYDEIKNAYESGKAILAYESGVANFVNVSKSGSDFHIYFANGEEYGVAKYGTSVVVTKKPIYTRYRHIVKVSGTIGGTAKVLTVIIDTPDKDEITQSSKLLTDLLRWYKCNSATDGNVLLVADSSAIIASIYVTSSMGVYTLHTKAIGDNAYSDNLQTTLTVTDTVINLY